MQRRLPVLALALSVAGSAALLQYEGSRNTAYLDSVQVPTICVGSTTNVRLGMVLTDAECAGRLSDDVRTAHNAIARAVHVPVTQGQYDALLSFTFNVGAGNLRSSTLLRKLNTSTTAQDCRAVVREFSRWVYAGGRRLNGLVARRAAEARVFNKGCAAWPGGEHENDSQHDDHVALVRSRGARRPDAGLAVAD